MNVLLAIQDAFKNAGMVNHTIKFIEGRKYKDDLEDPEEDMSFIGGDSVGTAARELGVPWLAAVVEVPYDV